MSYFKKKRYKSGLSKSDMARELGLTYERYNAIEKGDVKMPTLFMDKFNEIINRGSNKITNLNNMQDADTFWEEMKSLDENGKRKLYTKMREYNITTITQLAECLGYRSSGAISSYISGKFKVANEFKKRLYYFFNDELNIQMPSRTISSRSRKQSEELTKYYEETDFKALLKECHMNNKEFASIIGCHNSVISRMVTKGQRPGDKILQKVKDYFENNGIETHDEVSISSLENPEPETYSLDNTNFEELVPEHEELVKESAPIETALPGVVKRYKVELEEIEDLIEFHLEKLKDLKTRRNICLEVLQVCDELKEEE